MISWYCRIVICCVFNFLPIEISGGVLSSGWFPRIKISGWHEVGFYVCIKEVECSDYSPFWYQITLLINLLLPSIWRLFFWILPSKGIIGLNMFEFKTQEQQGFFQVNLCNAFVTMCALFHPISPSPIPQCTPNNRFSRLANYHPRSQICRVKNTQKWH